MKIPELLISTDLRTGFSEEITIVIPVFNQARIIVRNLEALCRSLCLAARVIIIDDGSTDGTASVISSYLRELSQNSSSASLVIDLYRFEQSQFETRCDAFGLSIADTDFVIEVQADMQVSDLNFDKRLVRAMTANPDLFAISGKGVEPVLEVLSYYRKTAGSDRSRGRTILGHIGRTLAGGLVKLLRQLRSPFGWKKIVPEPHLEIEATYYPNEVDFKKSGRAGFHMSDEEAKSEQITPSNQIWIGETVMRGPLIIDRKKYQEVGGFDTSSFFQCFDDHDLVLRAAIMGYPSGFSPVRYYSPLEDATSRKPRSFKSEMLILKNLMRISRSRKKTALAQLGLGKLFVPRVVPHVRHF